MRENIGMYRGKRKDNGEWVVGYYFERKDTQGNIIESVIIVDAYEQITSGQRYMRSNLNQECYRVDPETVGQYTGLEDKNGKKIFEWDFITFGHGIAWLVAFDLNAFVAMDCMNGQRVQFALFEQYDWNYKTGEPIAPDYFEVVGNIHDNPELLEVSK